MNSSGFRFICLLLSGISIFLGSALIVQSYSRLKFSMGDANLHVSQMEMISGAILIAGGLISLSMLAMSPSSKRNADD